jgi:hypothetical protein
MQSVIGELLHATHWRKWMLQCELETDWLEELRDMDADDLIKEYRFFLRFFPGYEQGDLTIALRN